MSCICQKAQPVPRCTGTLTVGTVTSLTSAVYVYIKNLATGRIERYAMTTDGSGTVTIDMSEAGYFYDVNNSFELWVSLQSAPQTRLTITANGESDTCLALTFEDHYNQGIIQEYANYTLTT